jgi:H+-transporting ATPase
MAEEKAVGAPALDTNIETGGFDEKRGQAPPATHNPKAPVADDEEPDEDMDALIEDLESEDGHEIDDEEETTPGGGRVVPEDQLQTDSRVGLTEAEVIARRKKWGLNAMKEERENMILKFLMFFVGPIQFVMVRFILFLLFFPPLFLIQASRFCDFPTIFKYSLSLRVFSSMFRSSAIFPRFSTLR